ncbi:glycosyltransferase family 4 protein [Intrasporangium sp. YIM S08009]|uniref:glycosyltransferase family 4 protein n=1 Tax=Intrasporangium zincisolvens TaxID=3080018 RepID=UPI002B06049D|nr:glycosyltransferase family 4 protein [Intrasporangium sp. YIM S08009]
MTTIVQITPEIAPGTGVGAVAHHLEQEWRRAGVDVRRFTLAECGGGWLPAPGGGVGGRLALLARVVWFSTVGTARARAHLRAHPEQLSVCHNDALAGDVYVNHGIVQVAMASRGHARLRLLRNPLHLFTTARDRYRYTRSGAHRVVVDLVRAEDRLLRDTYPALRLPTVVIGNGVDVDRFRPPTPAERADAREALGLKDADRVVLFIGNEFDRKGLPALTDALAATDPSTHLVVVGGTPELLASARARADRVGVAGRIHLVGAQPDPRPWLHAADVLATPSAYESYGLVVLEALACGVPVVATPTGCVPDVVVDGVNGVVVDAAPGRLPAALTVAIERVLALPPDATRAAARATAEEHSWTLVARRYLDLLTSLDTSVDDGRTPADARPGGGA